MAFDKLRINETTMKTFLVLLAFPLVVSSNIDCNGKAFHCVNSTHFMVCVDLGGGVSSTIGDFVIPCPPSTVCQKTNFYECEFPATVNLTPTPVTSASVLQPSEISTIWEESTVSASPSELATEVKPTETNTETIAPLDGQRVTSNNVQFVASTITPTDFAITNQVGNIRDTIITETKPFASTNPDILATETTSFTLKYPTEMILDNSVIQTTEGPFTEIPTATTMVDTQKGIFVSTNSDSTFNDILSTEPVTTNNGKLESTTDFTSVTWNEYLHPQITDTVQNADIIINGKNVDVTEPVLDPTKGVTTENKDIIKKIHNITLIEIDPKVIVNVNNTNAVFHDGSFSVRTDGTTYDTTESKASTQGQSTTESVPLTTKNVFPVTENKISTSLFEPAISTTTVNQTEVFNSNVKPSLEVEKSNQGTNIYYEKSTIIPTSNTLSESTIFTSIQEILSDVNNLVSSSQPATITNNEATTNASSLNDSETNITSSFPVYVSQAKLDPNVDVNITFNSSTQEILSTQVDTTPVTMSVSLSQSNSETSRQETLSTKNYVVPEIITVASSDSVTDTNYDIGTTESTVITITEGSTYYVQETTTSSEGPVTISQAKIGPVISNSETFRHETISSNADVTSETIPQSSSGLVTDKNLEITTTESPTAITDRPLQVEETIISSNIPITVSQAKIEPNVSPMQGIFTTKIDIVPEIKSPPSTEPVTGTHGESTTTIESFITTTAEAFDVQKASISSNVNNFYQTTLRPEIKLSINIENITQETLSSNINIVSETTPEFLNESTVTVIEASPDGQGTTIISNILASRTEIGDVEIQTETPNINKYTVETINVGTNNIPWPINETVNEINSEISMTDSSITITEWSSGVKVTTINNNISNAANQTEIGSHNKFQTVASYLDTSTQETLFTINDVITETIPIHLSESVTGINEEKKLTVSLINKTHVPAHVQETTIRSNFPSTGSQVKAGLDAKIQTETSIEKHRSNLDTYVQEKNSTKIDIESASIFASSTEPITEGNNVIARNTDEPSLAVTDKQYDVSEIIISTNLLVETTLVPHVEGQGIMSRSETSTQETLSTPFDTTTIPASLSQVQTKPNNEVTTVSSFKTSTDEKPYVQEPPISSNVPITDRPDTLKQHVQIVMSNLGKTAQETLVAQVEEISADEKDNKTVGTTSVFPFSVPITISQNVLESNLKVDTTKSRLEMNKQETVTSRLSEKTGEIKIPISVNEVLIDAKNLSKDFAESVGTTIHENVSVSQDIPVKPTMPTTNLQSGTSSSQIEEILINVNIPTSPNLRVEKINDNLNIITPSVKNKVIFEDDTTTTNNLVNQGLSESLLTTLPSKLNFHIDPQDVELSQSEKVLIDNPYEVDKTLPMLENVTNHSNNSKIQETLTHSGSRLNYSQNVPHTIKTDKFILKSEIQDRLNYHDLKTNGVLTDTNYKIDTSKLTVEPPQDYGTQGLLNLDRLTENDITMKGIVTKPEHETLETYKKTLQHEISEAITEPTNQINTAFHGFKTEEVLPSNGEGFSTGNSQLITSFLPITESNYDVRVISSSFKTVPEQTNSGKLYDTNTPVITDISLGTTSQQKVISKSNHEIETTTSTLQSFTDESPFLYFEESTINSLKAVNSHLTNEVASKNNFEEERYTFITDVTPVQKKVSNIIAPDVDQTNFSEIKTKKEMHTASIGVRDTILNDTKELNVHVQANPSITEIPKKAQESNKIDIVLREKEAIGSIRPIIINIDESNATSFLTEINNAVGIADVVDTNDKNIITRKVSKPTHSTGLSKGFDYTDTTESLIASTTITNSYVLELDAKTTDQNTMTCEKLATGNLESKINMKREFSEVNNDLINDKLNNGPVLENKNENIFKHVDIIDTVVFQNKSEKSKGVIQNNTSTLNKIVQFPATASNDRIATSQNPFGIQKIIYSSSTAPSIIKPTLESPTLSTKSNNEESARTIILNAKERSIVEIVKLKDQITTIPLENGPEIKTNKFIKNADQLDTSRSQQSFSQISSSIETSKVNPNIIPHVLDVVETAVTINHYDKNIALGSKDQIDLETHFAENRSASIMSESNSADKIDVGVGHTVTSSTEKSLRDKSATENKSTKEATIELGHIKTPSTSVTKSIQATLTESLEHQPSNNQNPSNNFPDTKNEDKNALFSYCHNKSRGRYSDHDDCTKFYICIGRNEPIVGKCPVNTVFSDLKKQCTKNKSHCIRNNQFKCLVAGRFADILKKNVYYICVKRVDTFIRFEFQCQKGYDLNKTTVKCEKLEPAQQSTSTDKNSDTGSSEAKSKERKHSTTEKRSKDKSKEEFECSKEGKFVDPNSCKKYYVCTKNKKSEFRRRRKSCDSDELFHKDKKKCVDADSYEC